MNKVFFEIEKHAKKHHIPIISNEIRDILKVIISIKKPLRVLELGTAIGYSASLIKAYSDENCKIDTIENDYEMILIAKENIEKQGLSKDINIIYGDATEAIMTLKNKYDLIFIDAAKNQYNEYLKYSLELLNEKGILIADNVLFKGLIRNNSYNKRKNRTIIKTLRKFLDTISKEPRLTTSILEIGDGVSISYFESIKKGNEDAEG